MKFLKKFGRIKEHTETFYQLVPRDDELPDSCDVGVLHGFGVQLGKTQCFAWSLRFLVIKKFKDKFSFRGVILM